MIDTLKACPDAFFFISELIIHIWLVMSSVANKEDMAHFRIASGGSILDFHLEVESEGSILLSERLLCLKF